jgi:radical SAM superfamily enzyme YgiQ (UPF0313 family)
MNNKKVLLLSPNSEDNLDSSTISYSMALGYLATSAKQIGWKPIVKDCYCEDWKYTAEVIKDIFKKENPSVLGINCITMNRIAAYKSINLARRLSPNVKIILGGVHPTIFPKHFLINHSADLVVLNEGEETFKEILNNFEKGISIKKVNGIAYKEKDSIKKTPPRIPIKNLDEMPFLDHSFFLNDLSTKAYFFSSRGCPNNCTFCSASVHWGRNYRPRSPNNIVNEIEYVLKKYPKVNEIRFMDDTFTLDNNRVINICKEMINRNLNVRWRCSGRVFPLSEETIKWMEKAGCIMISFGVESGSKKILKDVGKNQTPEQIFETFKKIYTNSKNITPEMFIILGFPGENESTVNETILLIKNIINISKKPLILTTARMLEIYPGTILYELAKRKKMIDDNYWLTNPKTPLYLEKNKEWYKKMRNRILIVNWSYAGIFPVIKLFFIKQMWKPKKIYNILRPYLKEIN